MLERTGGCRGSCLDCIVNTSQFRNGLDVESGLQETTQQHPSPMYSLNVANPVSSSFSPSAHPPATELKVAGSNPVEGAINFREISIAYTRHPPRGTMNLSNPIIVHRVILMKSGADHCTPVDPNIKGIRGCHAGDRFSPEASALQPVAR